MQKTRQLLHLKLQFSLDHCFYKGLRMQLSYLALWVENQELEAQHTILENATRPLMLSWHQIYGLHAFGACFCVQSTQSEECMWLDHTSLQPNCSLLGSLASLHAATSELSCHALHMLQLHTIQHTIENKHHINANLSYTRWMVWTTYAWWQMMNNSFISQSKDKKPCWMKSSSRTYQQQLCVHFDNHHMSPAITQQHPHRKS